MNTNAVADAVNDYLLTKHARVYRNRAPRSPKLPYIIYRVDSVINTMPSEDYYINVDVYDDVNKSVRAIEDIADSIDGNGNGLEPTGLNQRVIITDKVNMTFDRETRQYSNDEELVGTQLINLRYATRIYFL